MEGVPRIPMLTFPTRKSADSPAFKNKLSKFIAAQYGERPDSYSKEIHELETLRASAVHASRDYSGCAILKKYYCQLHFLKSRFPLSEGSPIAVNFAWYDVYTDQVHSWSDIDFEISSILYNIGALHSEVAGADSRITVDDMKNCVMHYQCAAWAFEHMRSSFQKFFTPDVTSDLLALMSTVCLAQAQECVVEKSLVDNRRSVITAKLLLQIVDYYQASLKIADNMLKDSSQHSDRIIKALRRWRKMIELKIAYYSSLTFLYRGQQSEDQKQFGERLAFYKAAQEKIETALKFAKNFDRVDGVHDTLSFAHDVIIGKASAAQKDNEFIYHEKVPSVESITESISSVALVKPIPLKLDDPGVSGEDIFGRLVPMEAHEASSLYSEEKAKLLRSYSQKLDDKNQALQKFVVAIQLENVGIREQDTHVPQELVDCCAAINGKPDAVKKLVELMGTLSGKYLDVDEALKEIKTIITGQETKEADYCRLIGKKLSSNAFAEVRLELEKYEKAHTMAQSSNAALREAVQTHVKNLKLLMEPLSELVKHIPSIPVENPNDSDAVEELKRLAGKVEEMKKQRESLHKDLREAVQHDDITQKLVVTQEEDISTLFQHELSKHNKITQLIDQNLVAQDNILRALTEANARYAPVREVIFEAQEKRSKVVHDLISSYEAYDELLKKCAGGIEFYNKLEESVNKLRAKTKAIAKIQDEELGAKILQPQLSQQPTLPIPTEATMGTHPKLKDYLANLKPTRTDQMQNLSHQQPVPVPAVYQNDPTNSKFLPPSQNIYQPAPQAKISYSLHQLPGTNQSNPPVPPSVPYQTSFEPQPQTPQMNQQYSYGGNETAMSMNIYNTPQSQYRPPLMSFQSGACEIQSNPTYSQATGSLFNPPGAQPPPATYDHQIPPQPPSSGQGMKYPAIISQASYAPKIPNYAYRSFASEFHPYNTPQQQPPQQINPYYNTSSNIPSQPPPTASTYSHVPGNIYNTPVAQPTPQGNYDQQIQSTFTAGQGMKYPAVISQASYTPKQPTYAYHTTSEFQSFTPPPQQVNAYYTYNNVPAQTLTSQSGTGPNPHQESDTSVKTLFYSGTPSMESLPANHGMPGV